GVEDEPRVRLPRWGAVGVDGLEGDPEVVLARLVEVAPAGHLEGSGEGQWTRPLVRSAGEDVGAARVEALVRRRLGGEQLAGVAQPAAELHGHLVAGPEQRRERLGPGTRQRVVAI